MQHDNKKQGLRLLIDVWQYGDFSALPEICHDDVQRHHERMPASGLAQYQQVIQHYRQAFTELKYDVKTVIAENGNVAIRYVVAGHHTGAFGPIPPTGVRSSLECIDWYRFRDGKIAEIWTMFDELGMLMKLGVIKM